MEVGQVKKIGGKHHVVMRCTGCGCLVWTSINSDASRYQCNDCCITTSRLLTCNRRDLFQNWVVRKELNEV